MKEGVEVFAILIFFIVILSVGTIFITGFSDSYYNEVPSVSESRRMIAMVKGSIYESGEIMSVFGTCVDAYDVPVENSTALFSAWYPNGTQYINQTNMSKMAEGYFLYYGPMQAVKGTYLTEMICQADLGGVYQTAKAWGEWQNPYWVARLANISSAVGNISLNLTPLEIQIAEGFNQTIMNITFLRENMTNEFEITNTLILETQVIANSSVDRNDSLLANLMHELLNISGQCCDNDDESLWWTEDVDRCIFNRDWSIRVRVYDESNYNRSVSWPDAFCIIDTSLSNPEYMEVSGINFDYTIRIITTDPFEWNVSCEWN